MREQLKPNRHSLCLAVIQLLALASYCLLPVNGKAQLAKAQWLVGGNINYLHSKTDGNNNGVELLDKSSSFNGSLSAGYFILERFCAGIQAELATARSKQTTDGGTVPPIFYYGYTDARTNSYLLGPFARYYLLPRAGKFNLIVQGEYAYGHNKSRSKSYSTYSMDPSQPPVIVSNQTESKGNTNNYGISLGPAFFITAHSSLEILAGYHYNKFTNSPLSGSSFSIGMGFKIHLLAINK